MAEQDKIGTDRVSGDRFEFVFEGPDVDDGTIRTRDLINVLTGLSDAFSRVSRDYEIAEPFELRLQDIQPGSIHILFEVASYAKENPAAATVLVAGAAVANTAITNLITGAYRVVTDIAKVVEAKKKLKGARVATTPANFSEGDVFLQLPDEPFQLTKEQYEILLSQRIDQQISKMVAPLVLGKIQNFQIKRSESELVRVEVSDRSSFDYQQIKEEKSREGTSIEGTLNSLSKNNMRGTFYTQEGVHVPYKYIGGDLNQLFRGFSARELVRVHGKVRYGTDGIPKFIDVENIETLQSNFFS